MLVQRYNLSIFNYSPKKLIDSHEQERKLLMNRVSKKFEDSRIGNQ